MEKYKVQVRCLTYNHSRFIEDALNGFAMQVTNFPFVVTIIDDASTDGNQRVITHYYKENFDIGNPCIARDEEADYGHIYYAQHNINSNCFFAIIFLKENHYSKEPRVSKDLYVKEWEEKSEYIALCEGDDYWVDSNKLQKQVDFLENNRDYTMCFHAAKIENCLPGECRLKSEMIEEREYFANELYEQWIVPTASMVFRNSVLHYMKGLRDRDRILNNDIVFVLSCCALGRVYGMSASMSIYRRHSGGVTYSKDLRKARIQKYPDHVSFIHDNFSFLLDKDLVKKEKAVKYLIRRKCYKVLSLNRICDIAHAFAINPFLTLRYIIGPIHTRINQLIHSCR